MTIRGVWLALALMIALFSIPPSAQAACVGDVCAGTCPGLPPGVYFGDRCVFVSTCVEGGIGVGIYTWDDDEEDPELVQCVTLVPDEPVQPCPPGKLGLDVLGTGQPCVGVGPVTCDPGEVSLLVTCLDDPTDPTPNLPGVCGGGVGTGVRINDNCYTVVVCQEGTGIRGTGVTLATNGDPSETCINSYLVP